MTGLALNLIFLIKGCINRAPGTFAVDMLVLIVFCSVRPCSSTMKTWKIGLNLF